MASSMEQPDDRAVFDAEQLSNVCGGDAEFESLVIGEFRKTSLSAFEQLGAAVAGGDSAGIKAWAHAIKGSSATIGAVALPRICQTLETLAGGSCDLATAAGLLENLRSQYDALDRALLEHLSGTR